MPLNWLIESQKWRFSLRSIFKLSLKDAFSFVFQGIAFGIITSARVGEYGGRIAYLPPEYRTAGTLSTFMCSLSQNIVTIWVALISSIFILDDLKPIVENKFYTVPLVFGLSVLIILFF